MDADGHGHSGPARCDLFEDLKIDLVRLVAAAPLLWVRQAEDPGFAERSEDVFRVGLSLLV